MANRFLLVLGALFWYASVRMMIYHYFIPRVLKHGEPLDDFYWWWSWFLAAPVTALSLFIPGMLVGFIV